MTGRTFSLLPKAPEKVFWHVLDRGVRVNGGQDLVLVTEQLVQHEQGEGRRGGVCIDHDVFQGPVILGEDTQTQHLSVHSSQVLFLHLNAHEGGATIIPPHS